MILLSEISRADGRPVYNIFDLKPLSPAGVYKALEKAHRYRLLNDPSAAESICLDILELEPHNQEALVTIVLAMSDRFDNDHAVGESLIFSFITRIIR